MPVSVPGRAVEGFHRKSMRELKEIQEKRHGIVSAYHARLYRQGYDTCMDGFGIDCCGLSSLSPSYTIWVEGWVAAFREITGIKDKKISKW